MLHPIMGPIPAKPLADVETHLSKLDHVIEALLVKFSFQFEYFFLQSGHPFDFPIVFGEFILQRAILCVKDPANFFSFESLLLSFHSREFVLITRKYFDERISVWFDWCFVE